MQKRLIPILLGCFLFISGIIIYSLNGVRTIRLIVDNEPLTIRTRKISVASILDEAKIPYTPDDRIFPNLNYWMTEDVFLRVDHNSSIELKTQDGTNDFTSVESLAGNMLLDNDTLLFPGDQLLWQDTPIQPDFALGNTKDIMLVIEPAKSFFFLTDADRSPQTKHASGATVGDALRAAGISISKSSLVFPSESTTFQAGMTIQVSNIRTLTIHNRDKSIDAISGGRTVGEALSRAGISLQGADYSIPDESASIPADGNIRIVRARDEVEITAETTNFQTDWSGNSELDLDETALISAGMNGMKGTRTIIHFENGEELLRDQSSEKILSEPINEKRAYGTKVTIRTLETEDGVIEYYRAVPVHATSYSPCRLGTGTCSNTTASGKTVDKGIIAMTVEWYRLFKDNVFYIPGYGKAIVADTGGGITDGDNHWVDLAYTDDDFVGWSRSAMLYFLTPVPEEMVWVLP